jgi:hypothetical protein
MVRLASSAPTPGGSSESCSASASIERARRAETPSKVSTASVAIDVVSGWCQNNQTMVDADSNKIAKKMTMFARAFDDFFMPATPGGQSIAPGYVIRAT